MFENIAVPSFEESRESKISRLIKEYHDKIYIYCFNILRNSHDAEDAVQEVFIKAFKSNNLLTIDNYSSWLYKIAYNHCINQFRRKSMVSFISFNSFTEKEKNQLLKEDINQDVGTDIELDYIFSMLKPKERALLTLRIVEDKDFNEIGSILGISNATTRKRFERVKNKIQNIIRGRLQDEGKN
ncbi:MAG: sigma-70 family RNA polymerase sigma factor [Kurthia sp.]|uniref:RNA polymerase sigma factor n=1 Tax=Solibacillus sp. FSL H8-0523 TaxID=2954511 RepID=UPI001B65A0BF|nr:sigma-70 family RNA polymerase sigma factor [Candidatus Kurthia equi]